MDPTAPQTQKQQITDILRQATNVVITTGQKPGVDAYAAAIALSQMLDKLGKRPEAVVSSAAPPELNFLPTNVVTNKFTGLRDFVIELDTSKVEADKLKYIPEGKRLKIYITPYSGNFAKDDLGYSYGDYHCDAVVALGANSLADLDPAMAGQKQLLDKTRVIFINAGGQPAAAGGNQLVWHEPAATSVCEMLMSLTEALQGGLLDNHIATALLTGIMAATEHFTAANTTPKVMTMAAQLMAAGADQADIVKHLQAPPAAPKGGKGRPQDLKASASAQLPHQQSKKVQAPKPAKQAAQKTAPKSVPEPVPRHQPLPPPPPPPPMPHGNAPVPPSPPHSAMISGVRTEHDGNPFSTVGGAPINTPNPAASSPTVNATPANSSLVGDHKPIDINAARQAVEAATVNSPTMPVMSPAAPMPPPPPAPGPQGSFPVPPPPPPPPPPPGAPMPPPPPPAR